RVIDTLHRLPPSPLFPYTTLFRSRDPSHPLAALEGLDAGAGALAAPRRLASAASGRSLVRSSLDAFLQLGGGAASATQRRPGNRLWLLVRLHRLAQPARHQDRKIVV